MCDSTCQSVAYVANIYNNRRANRYPERACRREYNQAAGVGCNLKPSFVAQPFLRYTQPNSYGEYELRQQQQAGPLLNKTGEPVRVNDKGEVLPARSQVTGDKRPDPNAQKQQGGRYCCNNDGYRPYRVPPAPDCKPCAITLSCGKGGFGESCQPDEWFRRREYPVGVTHIPASSLPIIPTYDWVNPDGLYHYDSPAAFARSYDGTYGGHLAAYAKFAFQNEAERLRLQYGIQPPFPPQPPTELPAQTAPRFQLPRPRAADEAPPIPYNQKYLDLTSNCGCNKSTCATCCNRAGTTCSTQQTLYPTPLSTIYAQQRNWPCGGDQCGDPYNNWMNSRGAFCKGCGSDGIPPNCPEKFPAPGSQNDWGNAGACY